MPLVKIGNRIINTEAIAWISLSDSYVTVYFNSSETDSDMYDEDNPQNPVPIEQSYIIFQDREAAALRKYFSTDAVIELPLEDDSPLHS